MLDKASSIPCRILDFCSGGFFLEFNQPNQDISLNRNVKLRFAIGTESNLQNFDIIARPVRITANGAGVAVNNMPITLFNALSNEANYIATRQISERRSSTPNRLKQEHCKKSFKNLLLEKLPLFLAQFFENLHEDLETANTHMDLFANNSALDDLVTLLQDSRLSFVSEFCGLVVSQVDGVSDSQQKKAETIIPYDQLALIAKEDFDDWLNISAIIRKLNNRFEDSSRQISRELVRVFGRSQTATINPISPAEICENFREMVLQFDVSNNIKLALYQRFQNILIEGLPALYELVGGLLRTYGAAEITAPPLICMMRRKRNSTILAKSKT